MDSSFHHITDQQSSDITQLKHFFCTSVRRNRARRLSFFFCGWIFISKEKTSRGTSLLMTVSIILAKISCCDLLTFLLLKYLVRYFLLSSFLFSGYSLGILWVSSGYSLGILWVSSGHSLGILWVFSGHCCYTWVQLS